MLRSLSNARVLATLAVVCSLTAAFALTPHLAGGASEGTLRDRIHTGKAREQRLGSAIERLGKLERETAREVTLLEGRVTKAQADLTAAQDLANRTADRLSKARARVVRLRTRLGEVRTKLAALLRSRYMSDRPDMITVVFDAHGFKDLLETMSFLQRVEKSDTQLLDLVRDARHEAGRQQAELTKLTKERREAAVAVQRRRDALVAMTDGLRAKRDALAQARAARQAALRDTRAGRRSAEKALKKLLAARARAASAAGPGGPWAIPWPIVQCESGGQNLPPNSAGASGYYQFLPDTWRGLGGSTPQAYQASKAEQDRLAARLWNGGAGAGNWVCASLVGIV